jgi:protein-disulfide reductase (glutathione)
VRAARPRRLARRAWLGSPLLCLALGAWPLGCYGAPARAPYALAPADWNEGEIEWAPYAEGMAAGKAQRRPIVLIFYTDWCPHCHQYSRLFHDPELVELSRRFVMIRVERDGNRDLSEAYALDGEYIPRTFFLTPSGVVLTDLASEHDEYRYFLDEHEPAELIGLMHAALARLVVPPRGTPGQPRSDRGGAAPGE